MHNAPLTLDDIADARAYEREREAFRRHIIGIKQLRRVSVGPVVTLVFENRETIRFQIQEMARAERLRTDAAIQQQLDTYNTLIPMPGHLSATLFIELRTREEMEQWLPKLVGIERSVELLLGDAAEPVRNEVEEEHAAQLTREDVTAAVHYVRFHMTPEQIDRFGRGPVVLAVNHPAYAEGARLSDETRASLVEDLLG